MGRLTATLAVLALLTGNGFVIPAKAVEWTYLFLLVREIQMVGTGTDPVSLPLPAANEKAEFDRICGQVQAAPSMTAEQLEQLIRDCLALTEVLKTSENPQAKIWIQRLKMCREFFEYSLEVLRGS